MATIAQDIVHLALEGKPEEMKVAIDSALREKIQAAIEQRRVEVAETLVKKNKE